MNSAEVDDKLFVNIQPEVVVALEFKDNIMSPRILAAGRLHESGAHLHAVVIIRRGSDGVK